MDKYYQNRYKVECEIGMGGMARVEKAFDTQMKRYVAIKIINLNLTNEEYINRFKSEAENLVTLNHPYIVTIHDYFFENNIPHIVMEYIDGGTLTKIISIQKKIDLEKSFEIIIEVSKALEYAHKKKIIHRDIKPSNILIRSDGIPILSDFGISKMIDSSTITRTNQVLGTYAYLSPEQAKGSHAQFGSDIYSLGIVLYQMITGRLPLESDSEYGFIYKHINEVPLKPDEICDNIPGNVCNIVMKMLMKDVYERYHNMSLLLVDLKAIYYHMVLNKNHKETKLIQEETIKVETPEIRSDKKDSFDLKNEDKIEEANISSNDETLLVESSLPQTPSSKNNDESIIDDNNIKMDSEENLNGFDKNIKRSFKFKKPIVILSVLILVSIGIWLIVNIISYDGNKDKLNENDDVKKTDGDNELENEYIKENFVYIEGGEFEMGSPESEDDRDDDELLHKVKLDSFYMGKYEVTIEKFKKFIEEENYETDAEKEGYSTLYNGEDWIKKSGINWKDGTDGNEEKNENQPVIHVSWNDAKAYCNWLSEEKNAEFRLPTEAEWEYVCRAGTKTPFNTGKYLTTEQANFNNKKKNTNPVGNYSANRWGLYDMHGNVWEWCEDWYNEDYYDKCNEKGTVENPINTDSGSYRVLRGGGWNYDARACRSAYRYYGHPSDRNYFTGFRVVGSP
ncbi:MAG: bifunctional serine/threonine-protein kinase/formylglycine-generating enzyme family protein [Clostridiales bacterium]